LLSHCISYVALLSLLLLPIICRRPTLSYCAAAAFIVTPPLPSLLHRRFCLLRRAAVTFIIAPLLIVAPPLPLSLRRRSLRCRATVSAFLVVPPVLPLSMR
jgi:hypothetical protein